MHPDDLGRVIGRAGRTAKALRTLVSALADGRRVRVDVVDTDVADRAVASDRSPRRRSSASAGSPRRTASRARSSSSCSPTTPTAASRRARVHAAGARASRRGTASASSSPSCAGTTAIPSASSRASPTAPRPRASSRRSSGSTRTRTRPAEDDAWYDHQLVGLDVVRDGVRVGAVARVDHLPAQDLLVVKTGRRRGAGAVRARPSCPRSTSRPRVVVVTPPAGLFEELPDEDPEPTPPARRSPSRVRRRRRGEDARRRGREPAEASDAGRPVDAAASTPRRR